jgi:LmbE family N-acetylglucosaminyl deacetylase
VSVEAAPKSLPDSALARSVLVVAHPDDEILWFASIAERVDRIVICFHDDPLNPQLSAARSRTLEAHPWCDKLHCLKLAETGAFGLADWTAAECDEYGLRLDGPRSVATVYRRRARELTEALRPFVEDADNVFTHNPWGEYGHEEHVMVYRVVESLVARTGTQMWCSNYASSWSWPLMLRYLNTEDLPTCSAEIDEAAMRVVADVYRANGTWTWFDDYRWFDREFFVRAPLVAQPQPGFGWLFPVNFVTLPDREPRIRPPGFAERARRRVRRTFAGRSR